MGDFGNTKHVLYMFYKITIHFKGRFPMKTKTKRIPEVRRAKARNIGYVRVDGKMKYLAGRYTEDGIDVEL